MRKIEDAISHMKERLRYCLVATTIDKDVVEMSMDALRTLQQANTATPIEEWGEDYGDCLWWKIPIEEPPYCGSPLDAEWQERNYDAYYTHFTRIIIPELN